MMAGNDAAAAVPDRLNRFTTGEFGKATPEGGAAYLIYVDWPEFFLYYMMMVKMSAYLSPSQLKDLYEWYFDRVRGMGNTAFSTHGRYGYAPGAADRSICNGDSFQGGRRGLGGPKAGEVPEEGACGVEAGRRRRRRRAAGRAWRRSRWGRQIERWRRRRRWGRHRRALRRRTRCCVRARRGPARYMR